MAHARGTNQHKIKNKKDVGAYMIGFLYLMILMLALYDFSIVLKPTNSDASESVDVITSPIADSAKSMAVVAYTPPATPTPTPTELEEIVAYITRVFEPEGKAVVVRAINCFYSESGLREEVVGQNNDAPRSKDWNVAQLNDYWHKLTEAEKTSYKANIDRAYEIYKGRGNSFSAWYGKLCN